MTVLSHTGIADHEKVHIRIVHHDYNFFTAFLRFLYKTFMTASRLPCHTPPCERRGCFTRLFHGIRQRARTAACSTQRAGV